jgi:Ca-activated chloride channel family protein
MTLTWPWALVALAAVPLLLGALWLVRRRRRKLAVRVSNVAAIRAAIPPHAHWKRRIPLALLVASLLGSCISAFCIFCRRVETVEVMQRICIVSE